MGARAESKRRLDQLYYLLVIKGPMTLTEVVEWTGWTYHDANARLGLLRRSGCAEIIEREQHRGAFNVQTGGRNRCGKWAAITDLAPDVVSVRVELHADDV